MREALIGQPRLQEAKIAWRKALDASPSEHNAWFGYAELCLFLGDVEEYRHNRRELLARFGESKNPTVCERAGKTCLLLPGTKEELEAAAALANRAVDAGRQGRETSHPYAAFAKGLAEYRMGRFDEAIAVMSGEAAKATLMGPSPRLIMSMAQYHKGQTDQARKTLSAAVVSYDWSAPKADDRDPWLTHVLRREAESLILPDLPAFLERKYRPRDNYERLALLGVCEFKELRATAAGLYAAAFAADPNLAADLQAGHCYHAARAAAVAGSGGGADAAALTEQERTHWRQQARDWLRLDLAAWTKRLEAAKPADLAEVQSMLARWPDEPDLAGLREPRALDQLPVDERQECRDLWSEVEARLKAAPSTG